MAGEQRDSPSDGAAPLVLEQFLPYRLSILSNTVSTAIAGAYAEAFELSIPEWRILAVLALYPGLSAQAVAERTAMDKVAVSRAVARLLAAGRISRAFADEDRRRSILRLSERGWAIYRRIKPLALGYERGLLAELSEREQALLDELIGRLQRRAESLGPLRPPAEEGD